MNYSVERQIPVVVCTTGLSAEQDALLKSSSEKVAVLKSANMSLGVNTLWNFFRPQQKYWLRQDLTWRSWRNITTRNWMHRAEPHRTGRFYE